MVHQYKLNGCNIVLDSNSGAIHSVDDVAYDIISLYQTHSSDEIVRLMLEKYRHLPDINEDEIRACIQDVETLKNNGTIPVDK